MCPIEGIVSYGKNYGYKALGLVDRNVLSGAISFKKVCEKQGIKPIFGLEFEINVEDRNFDAVLYAKDDLGFKNLMGLSSYISTSEIETVNLEILNKYRDHNVLCLLSDNMPLTYAVDKKLDLNEALRKQNELFGAYIVGLVDHDKAINASRDNILKPFLKQNGINCIALNRTYYLNRDDAEDYEILKCIRDKATINDENNTIDSGRHLLDQNEFESLYEKDELDYTSILAGECNVSLNYSTTLPEYKNKNNIPSKDYLVSLCKEGLRRRLKGNVERTYAERLDYELSVILKMHFEDYFLIVYDFILYAKKNNILVGPGRGCVQAGTLIYTENGLKSIEKIEVGEKVYTHKGNLKEVTLTHKYRTRNNEDLYKIRTFYDDKFGNAYTANHKILAIKSKKETNKSRIARGIKYKRIDNLKPQWIEANKLEVGDYVVQPRLKTSKSNYKYLDLSKYACELNGCVVKGNKIVYTKSRNTKDVLSTKQIELNANVSYSSLKRLLNNQSVKQETYIRINNYLESKGTNIDKWLASYSNRFETITIPAKMKIDNDLLFVLGLFTGDGWAKKNGNEFGVCFNKNDFQQEVLCKIERVFNLSFKKQKSYDDSHLLQFTASHPVYKEFLLDFWKGYKYTSSTKTFADWIFGISDDLKMSFVEGLWSADGSKKEKTKYTSVSWDLISKLKTLLTSLNIPNGLYYRPEHYSKNANVKHSKESWQILTSKNFANTNSAYNFISTKNFVAKRIFRIEKVQDKYVYDISVKDDHSYATSSFAAHNSGAGSLVAYCLGITDIDPIKYGLIFERFLNPERISMPDIDTDFPDDRRDEVIEYVRNKYGEDHVAHIITYGTLKAKQVLRDVGRALDYSTKEVDSICKLIPNLIGINLTKAYEEVPLFKQKIESDAKYRKLYKIARKLEFFPRHESTHAAGIVMSSKPLSEVVPVIKIENDCNSTQYTMEHLEELGLIKMDFLSIRNLSIIAEICDEINTVEPFNIKTIPLDDKKTFDLIDNVNVLGVFQLESSGMRNLIRKMKPKTFEEIGMTIALFRPGPMKNIPTFLENRAHPETIKYLHPSLKPILQETYGIIVYQEQIIQIARTMAGFSYGKADILRKAMSKKKMSELESLYSDFMNGCVNNGYDSKLAQEIYDLILEFANYGFNKSHSVAYAMVAYELAYLKANYPLYFYKALLNGVIGAESKTYDYISECQNVGQRVRGISLNESGMAYRIVDNSILMPLSICRDCGSVAVQKIIQERNAHGKFKDYVEAVTRLVNNGVEKNAIENLIYAGAFDEFGHTRHTMIEALPNVLMYASAHKGDISLLDNFDDAPIINELNDDNLVKAENEKAVLGFYFSFNPIVEVKNRYNIHTDNLYNLSMANGYVSGFGLISRVKSLRTKKGDMMAFVDLIDDKGALSLAVMPNIYSMYSNVLVKGKYVCFEGNMEREASCLVKKMRVI